jgi:predicted permease
MRSLLDDLRYAFRALRKNPVLTSVAVLSLGIGIGANTAIFSLMDRVLFRALDIRDPRGLLLLRSAGGWSGSIETSYGDDVSFSFPKFLALQEQSGAVAEGVLARYPFGASIAANAQTDASRGELVTGNYFDLLGIRPALGRLLTAEDSQSRGSRPVAVLSHGYWTRRFGGDPGILNQILVVNGTPLTVVGIAQAGFRSVGAGESPSLFVPVTMAPELAPPFGAQALDNPHAYWLNVFVRLRPGVSREQAAAAFAVIWQRILASDVDRIPAVRRERYLLKRLELLDGGSGISSVRNDVKAPLYLLMGMVGLVLLIACANVANLLLARAVTRGKEIAIRVALGASRGRLVRHVLAESLLLSLAGGAVGLIVASWTGHLMLGVVPEDLPTAGLTAELDARVLAFTFAISVVTGLLFGCAPALRATRPDLAPVLKQGAVAISGQARLRRLLVAGQIAISAILLASAGLFANSLHNLRSLDPGFRAAGVDSFSINPRLLGYQPDRTQRLFAEFLRELRAIPGVAGVSMAKWTLLTNSIDMRAMTVEGYRYPPGAGYAVNNNTVGPGFFSVMGISMLNGREFHEGDNAGAPGVAVVNDSFARKYFAGGNPIGKHLNMARISYEIVGVAKDARYDDLREPRKPFVYFAAAQDRNPGPMSFYVRGAAAPDALASAVRSLARRLDPALTVDGPRPVQQQILASVFVDRMVAMLASTFAVLATLLAAIGLYGVVAWAVSGRRREIGIRMALGAEPGSIMRMVLGDVLRLGAAGILIAAPLWALTGRLLGTLLFGVTQHDPSTLAAALAVVIAVAAAAGFLPAWRASRLDPNSAIRQD